jgi:hypothetical protein
LPSIPSLPDAPVTPVISVANVMKSRYSVNINQVFNDYLLTDRLELGMLFEFESTLISIYSLAQLNLDELFGLWHISITDSNLALLSKLIGKEIFQIRLQNVFHERASNSSR